jgi:hypothetical protein
MGLRSDRRAHRVDQIGLRMRKLRNLKVFRFLNQLTPVRSILPTDQTGSNRSNLI